MTSQTQSKDLLLVAFADSALSLITSSMKLTFYDFATDIPSSFWLSSTISILGFIYIAKNQGKKVQRIAVEKQHLQRITAELQDRVLQQEVRSQDQFAQLHTAISESRGLNGPHKDFVKLIWEDGPNGRVAGLERTTAGRKSHEKIKINQKSAWISSIG